MASKTPLSGFSSSYPTLPFFVLHFYTLLINAFHSISKKVLSLPTVKKKDNHIQNLISEGEHQMLDFKFEISDSRRIARSLAAFANTDGGRLLVGVKDNGAIAGVRSDEEIHMIQAAAEMYCQPKVEYTTEEQLLHYLSEHEEITLKEFQQMAHINKRKAEAILADFIIVGTIDLIQTSQRTVFRLSQASIFN